MLLNKVNSREEVFSKIPLPTSDGFELVPVEEQLSDFPYFRAPTTKCC